MGTDMVDIGRFNRLQVVKQMDFGLYLAAGEGDEILLPKRYIPKEGASIGDWLEVFVYLDSEDRPVATTLRPRIQVGGFACLQVAEINRVGLFLDWGLPKDLLLPHSEERKPLQVGDRVVVHAYLDRHTQRITATARLDRYLDKTPANYKVGQPVELLVVEQTDLGFKAIIEGRHWGLIHKNEAFKPLRPGSRERGFIRQIRDDGKLSLSLQPVGIQAAKGLEQQILAALEQNGGRLPLGDKSSPEQITRQFGVSKANFKKAIGGLYKQGLIRLLPEGIEQVR